MSPKRRAATDQGGDCGEDAVVVRLFTAKEAMKDFGVDLRDFGQADPVRSLGSFCARGGWATKVDFKLQQKWVRNSIL